MNWQDRSCWFILKLVVVLFVVEMVAQFFLINNSYTIFPEWKRPVPLKPVVEAMELECGWRIVTAYSSTVDQTDADPFTMANGQRVRDGVVASNEFKFGTRLFIADKWYTVEDRTNSRFKYRIDIWMPTRDQALQWGSQAMNVCW